MTGAVHGIYEDADAIIQVLASRPTPDQVLSIRPSEAMQSRASELLGRSKEGALSREEEAELERYFLLEHLVRLAKARALEELERASHHLPTRSQRTCYLDPHHG